MVLRRRGYLSCLILRYRAFSSLAKSLHEIREDNGRWRVKIRLLRGIVLKEQRLRLRGELAQLHRSSNKRSRFPSGEALFQKKKEVRAS